MKLPSKQVLGRLLLLVAVISLIVAFQLTDSSKDTKTRTHTSRSAPLGRAQPPASVSPARPS